MITHTNNYRNKPKKYSRKSRICSCECPIFDTNENILDKIMVKYEVEPNKDLSYVEFLKKKYWTSFSQIWGEFEKVIELSPIFDKLKDTEYTIATGFFTRDKVQMPFISSITVNSQKYLTLKKQEERKMKLKKLK